MLSSTESSSGAEPITHYMGLSTEAVASGLKPFTQYTVELEVGGANSYKVKIHRLFLIPIWSISACTTSKMSNSHLCEQACSSGGCTSTPPLSLLTASAPPQNQPPPRVSATGPHALHVSWEPPSHPNGRTPDIHTHATYVKCRKHKPVYTSNTVKNTCLYVFVINIIQLHHLTSI